MADAGDLWFRGFASAGQSIGAGLAEALQQYQQQQQKIHAMDQVLSLGSQMTYKDPEGKELPLVNPKFAEAWSHYSNREKARNEGGMEILLKMSQTIPHQQAQVSIEQSKAAIAKRAVDMPFFDMGGTTFQNTVAGARPVTQGQAALNAIKEARIAAHQTAGLALKRRKEIDGLMKNEPIGMGPDEFLSQKAVPGIAAEDGTFTPDENGPDVGLEMPGKEGNTYTPIKGQDYTRYMQLADEYQKLGQTAFGGLTGGKQTAPVKVNTPEEARKLPPGTLYQAPNGQIYQIPVQ